MKLNFNFSFNLAVRVLLFAVMIFAFAGAAHAARTVPGDVIVTFENPIDDLPVSKESLTLPDGLHAAWLAETAKSLDSEVKMIYETLSIQGNDIAAVLHSDSKSESTLWLELRMRQDVKAASLNHVMKISGGRKKFAR